MRTRTPGLALALLAALLAGDGALASPASEIEDLVKTGKLDDAVAKGRAAVGKNPDDPDLRLALAHAVAAKGRRLERILDPGSKAKDATAGPLKLPNYASTGPSKLRVVYEADAFEEAILHLGEGIRRAPKRKDLRLARIYLLTDAGRIERAVEALRETAAALPRTEGLADELAAFGAERAKRGDDRGGAELLGVVVSKFPDDPEVQADYGFTLARLGRKVEAFKALDRAAQLAPKDLKIQRMRANVALLNREFARAETSFQAAFLLSRDDLDRVGAAAAAYGADPRSSETLFHELASPAASAGPGTEDLASRFLLVVEKGPASPEALVLARELVSGGKEMLAVPLLERVLRADPKSGDARSLLAQVYRSLRYERLARETEKTTKATAGPSTGK